MNCDNRETATGPRCKKKARVKIIYVTKGRTGLLANLPDKTVKCWQHYIDLENRARHPGATFRIVKTEMIK